MPNKDGTGPQGQGRGIGRFRGGCASGRRDDKPGKGQGRRPGGSNCMRITGGGPFIPDSSNKAT
ncbi:MAG: hypothetical protein ACOX0E_01585 [Syntrophomonadaceae bacterium]|jgi:hypothetical protein